MNEKPPTRVAEWLRASRGRETQEALAEDVTNVTGWRITRDRYSKYESGSLPIGPVVLAHFVDYWKSRGVAGPDEQAPRVADPEPADALLAALAAQTAAITAQTAALTSLVEEIRAGHAVQTGVLEGIERGLAVVAGMRQPAVVEG